ncbi:MAG: hypothetical protein J1F32_05885 [Erysipelotrichales bacterium]|nr:hypothetical protein [Erysipelotrichales bacterium]
MEPIEIIVITITVLIVVSVIGNYTYRKIKHLPTGECACCKKKGNNLVKQYRKLYPKSESKCSCSK